MKFFMGIDVGTYSSKGVIIDEQCRIIASHQITHNVMNPRPGYFEHDAEKIWWQEVCLISQKLLSEGDVPSENISGLGISALGCDVVPVDRNCNALCNAILYGIDTRASEEIEYLNNYNKSVCKNKLLNRPFNSSDCIPKILWLKNNRPEIYNKTSKFLTASSFITAKLTGEYVIDQFLINCFAPAYDINNIYRSDLLQDLCCRSDQFATVAHSNDIVGYVTAQAAAQTGLATGTPVTCGTDDSGAEAISAGVLEPGDMMIQLGSTCYIIYCSDRHINDTRMWNSAYLIPGTFCIDGGTNAAGALTKWVRDTMYPDLVSDENSGGKSAYAVLADRAANIPAGSEGLIMLPYFSGERTPINDASAKGILYGLLFHHTRDHIYRSAIEATAYAIAQHVKIIQSHQLPIHNLLCVGGGAKNNTWLQIIADVTGINVQKPAVTIGASYGDAMIAAIGTKHFKSFGELHHYIAIEKQFTPDPSNKAVYEKGLNLYTKLYQNTSDLMHTYK